MILPTFVAFELPEPFSTFAAFFNRLAAGVVFKTNVNDLSSNAVMITGTMSPARSRVASLNAAQNCGMFTLADAKAGPGRAAPAANCSLTTFAIFLLTSHSSFLNGSRG